MRRWVAHGVGVGCRRVLRACSQGHPGLPAHSRGATPAHAPSSPRSHYSFQDGDMYFVRTDPADRWGAGCWGAGGAQGAGRHAVQGVQLAHHTPSSGGSLVFAACRERVEMSFNLTMYQPHLQGGWRGAAGTTCPCRLLHTGVSLASLVPTRALAPPPVPPHLPPRLLYPQGGAPSTSQSSWMTPLSSTGLWGRSTLWVPREAALHTACCGAVSLVRQPAWRRRKPRLPLAPACSPRCSRRG